jgi:hypothetical protein
MQALTQVGGFTAAAKRKKISVLRPITGTGKVAKIEIDISRIVNGQDNDFPLYANDILYVDRVPALVAVLPTATSSLISSLPYIILTAILR